MPVKVYDGTNWVTVAGDGAQGAAATSSSIATWVKTASGGETSLSGNDDNSQPLSYTAGQELVYINGVLQKRDVDYVATTGTTITGLNALAASDVVTVWTVNAFSVTNAIPNSTITAKGNLIVGTGSGTYVAQTVGTDGQVLTADSTQADGVKWAAGGKVLQVVSAITTTSTVIATTTMTDTTITATITPTSTSSKILVLINGVLTHGINSSGSGVGGQLMRGASVIQGYASAFIDLSGATGATRIDRYARIPIIYMDSPATTSATTYKLQGRINDTANSGTSTWQASGYGSSIVLMEIGA